MAGLIVIKAVVSGNLVTTSINPELVGSTLSTSTTFSIFLNSINSSSTLTNDFNYQTRLTFTGSLAGEGYYMGDTWETTIQSYISGQPIQYIDFYTPGFTLSRTILGS